MDTREVILSLAQKAAGMKQQPNADTPFSAMEGWNSLQHAWFIHEVEKQFQVEFSLDDLLAMHTLQDVIIAVDEKRR